MFGYGSRDVEPGERARSREGNNGLALAGIALLVLLIAIIAVFLITFTTSPYCSPTAPCNTGHAAALLVLRA